MAAPDLSRAVAFRSIQLNTVTESNVAGLTVIIGNQLDFFDLSDLEIRQFTEPLALTDGIDVGGVWLGARRIVLRGTSYDKTRGECYDRIKALEDIMVPASGTFGFYDLTFSTIAGSSSTPATKTISCRPNGLRYAIDKSKHGLSALQADMPLAISWAVSLFVKSPSIT